MTDILPFRAGLSHACSVCSLVEVRDVSLKIITLYENAMPDLDVGNLPCAHLAPYCLSATEALIDQILYC